MAAPPVPLALPRLQHADTELVRWADQVLRLLQMELQALRTPAGTTPYALSNVTATRTLDPSTATATDTAQALATLIQDLKLKGHVA